MNHEQKMRLLNALTETACCPNPFEGICWNVNQRDMLVKDTTNWMNRTYRKWPRWSGSYTFPVKPTDNCYYHAAAEGSMWDTDTQYGRDRWDLLRFLIMEMLDELDV